MDTVHVVAIITAQPGQRDALLDAFRENVPNVLAEDGCIEYQATIDAEGIGGFQAPVGPDTFVVVEKWANLDALKAHAATQHMKEYAASTKDMVADRAIHVLSPT